MRPIDIQNAIDHVQAAERILHVRKLEEGETSDFFARRLSEEIEHKTTSVPDTEHTEGLRVEEEGSGGAGHYGSKKKKQQNKKKQQEERPKLKEDGKGNILDINA